jgi:Uma2 family endonuclease
VSTIAQRVTKLTVDEFLAEYGDVDDGNRYELQDGEVIVVPPPGSEHGELHIVLAWLLSVYEESHPGIRIFDSSGVEFSDDTLRGPDVTIVKPSDDVSFKEKSRMTGAPSVIIEIVSPGKPRLDLVVKRGLYTGKGVAEIWFLDIDTREALFLCKSRSNYVEQKLSSGVFESKVLKGLRVDVAALFALDKRKLRKALEGRKS